MALTINKFNITTALFAPPSQQPVVTDPYWSNVSMLLKGDGTDAGNNNTFLDSSTNNFTITRTGVVTQGTKSPFASSGGSVSLPGGADYLTVAGDSNFAFGTGDFTIEMWLYRNVAGAVHVLYDSRAASVDNQIGIAILANNTMQVYKQSGAVATGTATISANAWHHLAVVRSGTSLKTYVNGVQDASVSDSVSWGVAANRPLIGAAGFALGGSPLNGYMSNLRVVKGTAVYTANFTPSTTPLTAISGTSLLLKGENGQITDSKALVDLTTIGNVQISTTTKKYGVGSIALDGTGDWLSSPTSTSIPTGTEDFTVECWVYRSTTGADQGILSIGTLGTDTSLRIKGSNSHLQFWFNGSGAFGEGTTALATGTWYHVAWTRSGTTSKVYLNGSLEINYTDASVGTNLASRPFVIGATYASAPEASFNGFIDDFRVTKGVARYTANFTPPTEAPTS